jgi:hypothetical protein
MPCISRHRSNGQLRTIGVLTCLAVLVACSGLTAQQPPPVSGLPVPRLFTVFPCGGKSGSTIEVTFSGQDIEEPESLLFSQPGI